MAPKSPSRRLHVRLKLLGCLYVSIWLLSVAGARDFISGAARGRRHYAPRGNQRQLLPRRR